MSDISCLLPELYGIIYEILDDPSKLAFIRTSKKTRSQILVYCRDIICTENVLKNSSYSESLFKWILTQGVTFTENYKNNNIILCKILYSWNWYTKIIDPSKTYYDKIFNMTALHIGTVMSVSFIKKTLHKMIEVGYHAKRLLLYGMLFAGRFTAIRQFELKDFDIDMNDVIYQIIVKLIIKDGSVVEYLTNICNKISSNVYLGDGNYILIQLVSLLTFCISSKYVKDLLLDCFKKLKDGYTYRKICKNFNLISMTLHHKIKIHEFKDYLTCYTSTSVKNDESKLCKDIVSTGNIHAIIKFKDIIIDTITPDYLLEMLLPNPTRSDTMFTFFDSLLGGRYSQDTEFTLSGIRPLILALICRKNNYDRDSLMNWFLENIKIDIPGVSSKLYQRMILYNNTDAMVIDAMVIFISNYLYKMSHLGGGVDSRILDLMLSYGISFNILKLYPNLECYIQIDIIGSIIKSDKMEEILDILLSMKGYYIKDIDSSFIYYDKNVMFGDVLITTDKMNRYLTYWKKKKDNRLNLQLGINKFYYDLRLGGGHRILTRIMKIGYPYQIIK